MQPIRLDPVNLILMKEKPNKTKLSTNKPKLKIKSKSEKKSNSILKTQLKEKLLVRSRKSQSNTQSNSRSNSRSRSRKISQTKSRSRSKSQERKRQIDQEMYHPIKLESPRRSMNSKNNTRISSNRAIFQRMTPYYSKKETVPAFSPESKTIKELEILEKETNRSPVLNQLVKESILIRV
jgi:hypothetical protein